MTAKTVTFTCPSYGISKEVPVEKIPPSPVNATCRACGHVFPFSSSLGFSTLFGWIIKRLTTVEIRREFS